MSRIRDEIKQTRPFPSKAQEATVGLLRAADLLRRGIAVVLEPYGITGQQYNVLRILRGAGEAGLPTLEIAERMIEQTPGITRLLDRLEAKKLVRRERCPTDRRQVLCYIAPRGLALLESLDAPVAAADEKLVGQLSRREISVLIDLLDRTRQGVNQFLASGEKKTRR